MLYLYYKILCFFFHFILHSIYIFMFVCSTQKVELFYFCYIYYINKVNRIPVMKYEETIHNFKDSLKIEEENFDQQDSFYHKYFNQEIDIIRIPYNTPLSQKLQKDDIDLIIKLKDGACKISEKIRTVDFNDILFEIYSDIEKDTLGWSMNSKSDMIFYFVKTDKDSPIKYVYIIETEQIKQLLNEIDSEKLKRQFDRNISEDNNNMVLDIPLLNGKKLYNVKFRIATNYRNSYKCDIFHTCNICIDEDNLKKLGINIKKYYLNEN